MVNIKQNFLKLTISFAFLLLSACSGKQANNQNALPNSNILQVAILLPMTGEDSALGKQYIQMIKMGLSDGAKTSIKVAAYDTGDEQLLNIAIGKILAQGTDIVIGPLYSAATKTVAEKLKDTGITLISLSNDPTLADNKLFVFGHAPMRQFEQIATYFLDNKYENYSTLLPNGRHSQTVAKIIQELVTSKGANIAKSEFYNSTPEDISRAVAAIAATVDSLNESDSNLKKPVILMADDPKILKIVYENIRQHNLDTKAIIAGDNRIDIDLISPLDIVFTGSTNIINAGLKNRAEKIGIRHLSFIHAIAYDAGKMVATFAGDKYNNTQFLEKMHGTDVFSGSSGEITFVDSIAQRRYDIIKRDNIDYIELKKGN